MVDKGGWRVTRPEVEGHAGFALNALLSPHANASWAKLAAEYVAVHDDPERLRTFKNRVLGEGWAESVDALEPEALIERIEPFGLNGLRDDGTRLAFPAAVLLLTLGVDVQDDRLEPTLLGHDKDGGLWALAHFVLWGSSEGDGVWRELDGLIETRWDHPLGAKIGIEATAVDAGVGGIMDRVCAYAWARSRRGVLAVKGAAGKRPVIARAKAAGPSGRKGPLWIVGVDEVKASLLTRLSRAPETIRFSASVPLAWF
jgi:phage terminase large subunit GpA-like protein